MLNRFGISDSLLDTVKQVQDLNTDVSKHAAFGYIENRDAKKDLVEEPPKPPFKGPYTKSGETRKDQFGNVISPHNITKHLVKLARNRVSMKKEDVAVLDQNELVQPKKSDIKEN